MRGRHSQAMIIQQVKKEFKLMEGHMTAFQAYWLAVQAKLAMLRTAPRTFWRLRNADN